MSLKFSAWGFVSDEVSVEDSLKDAAGTAGLFGSPRSPTTLS